MEAKNTSHVGMIVGAVGLLIIFSIVIFKYVTAGICPSVDNVKALILIGIAPSIPFCPVYLSIWLDKLAGFKK